MKNFIKSMFLVGIVFFASCGDFEEINTDPTSPASVSLDLMLPEVLTQTMFNQGSNPVRVAGIIMQQFVGFDAQQVAYTDYVLPDVTFDNYWQTGLYSGSLRSANLIINTAEAEGAPHYAGIARIMMAAGLGDAASYFGDIPFSEALQGAENFKPAYDTQEEIYTAVQSLLDQAIVDLSADGGVKVPGGDDLIFGGNAASWIATANALKARYLMHTIKRNPGNAATILSLIQNSAFQDASGQPTITWGTAQTDNNPLAKFGLERPNTLIVSDGFFDMMEANNDPRIEGYMAPEEDLDENDMPIDTLYWKFHSIEDKFIGRLNWSQNNTSVPLITLEELKFIEAELLLASGDAVGAKAAMSAAITANMAQNGVDGTSYIADAEVRFDVATDQLEVLMEEAYVAYYGHAFHQTWANYRRTGFPTLTPSPNGDNGLNPGGAIPRRYIYPLSEDQTNSESLQAAKDNQGGALMNVDLWSFQ